MESLAALARFVSSQQPPVFRHWTSMVQAFVRRGNWCIWIRSEERPGVRMCWSEPLGSNPDTSRNVQSFQSFASAWLCWDVQNWIHFLNSVFLLQVSAALSVENGFQFLTSSSVQQCEPGLRLAEALRPDVAHRPHLNISSYFLCSSLWHWCLSCVHWITVSFMLQVRGSVCCCSDTSSAVNILQSSSGLKVSFSFISTAA